jgi:environmental stress-induced protein Ves
MQFFCRCSIQDFNVMNYGARYDSNTDIVCVRACGLTKLKPNQLIIYTRRVKQLNNKNLYNKV